MTAPHVLFIHGFNVRDNGANTVGRLVPFFATLGCSTEMIAYGHFNLLEPRWENHQVAELLADRINAASRPVIVVAHSNGCAITHKCNATIDKAVYINPALDRDAQFPASILAADVWHSRGDMAVWLSRLLPFNAWGDMGAVGAARHDRRVKNFDKAQNYELSSTKHSDVFKSPLVEYFGPIIAKEALCRLER